MTGIAASRVTQTGVALIRAERGTVRLEDVGPRRCHIRSCVGPARFRMVCECGAVSASCARHPGRVIDALVVNCVEPDPHPGVRVVPVA